MSVGSPLKQASVNGAATRLNWLRAKAQRARSKRSSAGELLSGEDVRAKSQDELLDKSAEAAERLVLPLTGASR